MPTYRILLAEDDATNRNLIARCVERAGYSVFCAVDGVQALMLARSEQPDLILMDINMPRMNGWEATRMLKEAPETRSIPVIALTAFVFAEHRQRSREVGCSAHLTKPIDFEQLFATIQALI